MTEIEEMNESYTSRAVNREGKPRVFPFLSKHRVNVLEKGYYLKNKANYRGLTYVYDKTQQENKTLLIGFYYVPEDMVIVTNEVEITDGKQSLIETYTKQGYTKLDHFPSLKPIQFHEGTKEYDVAYDAYLNFKNKEM